MRSVYPIGTTIYKPDLCWNGYTIYWQGYVVYLIDMNGRSVREWHLDAGRDLPAVDRARLLENGNVLVQRGGMMSENGLLQEYTWDREPTWEWIPEETIPHTNLLGNVPPVASQNTSSNPPNSRSSACS